MIIVIDGPAGTGKTTIARTVADKLGYEYFDTGAMYRAVTYSILRDNTELGDEAALKSLLDTFQFDIQTEKEHKQYFVNGQNLSEEIRSSEVTQHVSEVAAHAEVRKYLVEVQRMFGARGNVVFEGRDMGTVVFPQAEVKIFLTARPSVRAERRYAELKEKGVPGSEEKVLEELLKRDHFDSTREVSPLKQAEDAHLIDTSDLTIDQVTDQILALVSKGQKR